MAPPADSGPPAPAAAAAGAAQAGAQLATAVDYSPVSPLEKEGVEEAAAAAAAPAPADSTTAEDVVHSDPSAEAAASPAVAGGARDGVSVSDLKDALPAAAEGAGAGAGAEKEAAATTTAEGAESAEEEEVRKSEGKHVTSYAYAPYSTRGRFERCCSSSMIVHSHRPPVLCLSMSFSIVPPCSAFSSRQHQGQDAVQPRQNPALPHFLRTAEHVTTRLLRRKPDRSASCSQPSSRCRDWDGWCLMNRA